MKRRDLLRTSAATAAFALGSGFWRHAFAAPARPGVSPYGPLAAAPDANGLRLPAGFTSRVLAITGLPVLGTSHIWHVAPDGGACFPLADGGWAYTSNSEVPVIGGAAMVRFDAGGRVVEARTLLSGTTSNCAGGPTPWGTWLSCEEWEGGNVFECYLDGRAAARRSGLGTFAHEAVAVDPSGRRLYLTEDRPNGRFYRFTPDRYPSLASGRLEAARVSWSSDGLGGTVSWVGVETWISAALNPFTSGRTTGFNGGEGCWYDDGVVYFTTKGDNRVWAYSPSGASLECIYSAELYPESPLRGVDNLVVSRSGDLFVAEDGDNMQLCLITPDRTVAPFLQVEGHAGSEITGPAFSPAGDRLYFSSQRGPGGHGVGVTFEVSGPFRR
ncbi:translocation protein TolB [Sorangium cellulosum]|uniref:Translocation protein TolB n=1 Tax=Sorangium cellulosum TaxID=56 RepID=A0A2L0F1A1_SORCE|nr:alkaline phosphatase PhoX [Sorangium cellulosum]AUX45316.1 translocation protein TolB [Sorangium cellulosum]